MSKIHLIALSIMVGIFLGCDNKSPVEPSPIPTPGPTATPTATPTPVPNATLIFYVVKKSDMTVLIPNSPVRMVADRDGKVWYFPNPTGEFQFTVPVGSYKVTVTSAGYKDFHGTYQVTTQNGWPWVWAVMEPL